MVKKLGYWPAVLVAVLCISIGLYLKPAKAQFNKVWEYNYTGIVCDKEPYMKEYLSLLKPGDNLLDVSEARKQVNEHAGDPLACMVIDGRIAPIAMRKANIEVQGAEVRVYLVVITRLRQNGWASRLMHQYPTFLPQPGDKVPYQLPERQKPPPEKGKDSI